MATHDESGSTELPRLVPLDSPRRLRADEEQLARFLIDDVDGDELVKQLSSTRVVSECSCGCPSVGLATDEPGIGEEAMSAISGGRADWAELSAWGSERNGHQVQVNLHLVHGRVFELEVWAGWDGGDPVVALPDLDSLTRSS